MTIRPATLNDVFLHLTASAPEYDLAAAAGAGHERRRRIRARSTGVAWRSR